LPAPPALSCPACASTNQVFDRGTLDYIRQNDLSARASVHVISGRIYRGMPVKHAIASLGEPTKRDTSSWDGGTQVKLMCRSRADVTVTRWENLETIPRLDTYYESSL